MRHDIWPRKRSSFMSAVSSRMARALPVRSSPKVTMAGPENADAAAADRTVPANITLPGRLLRRIDERARNRFAFLARAAEKALAEGRPKRAEADPLRTPANKKPTGSRGRLDPCRRRAAYESGGWARLDRRR